MHPAQPPAVFVGFVAVFAAAAMVASPIFAQNADPALERYFQANALYNKRLYPLAADEFRAFLVKNGNHPKADAARFGLALCEFAQQKYAEAEPLLKALAAKNLPETERILLMHGQCLLETGKAAEAEQRFAGALKRRQRDRRIQAQLPGGFD